MNQPPDRLTPQELRALTRSLAGARDEQLMRAVAMVDGLGERGPIDGIIAPLRPRLAALRPARPLRFIRLMFLPLDPLIVPAPKWRPGSATVPRTALAPLAAAVRDAIGSAVETIETAIAGHSVEEKEIVAKAGEALWPRAGLTLATAPKLICWPDTGLPAGTAAGVATAVGAVLLAVVPLRRLLAEVRVGVTLQPESVQAILAEVAPFGSEALAMAVAVLLACLPEAAALLARGASVLGPDGAVLVQIAAGQASDLLVDWLEAAGVTESLIGASSLDESGTEVRRMALLLDGLEKIAPRPQRQRLGVIRERLEQSCRSRFIRGLESALTGPLRSMVHRPAPEEFAEVENAARGLRQLETAARRFGGGPFYDAQLHNTAAAVWASTAEGVLGLADRVRLVEILKGADVAEALLEKALPAYRIQSIDPHLLVSPQGDGVTPARS